MNDMFYVKFYLFYNFTETANDHYSLVSHQFQQWNVSSGYVFLGCGVHIKR